MTFSAVFTHWQKGVRETESDWKRERARQKGIAVDYTMPSALTYPSGVSFFTPPLPLTLLAPDGPITGLERALPGQGHVVGVCYESAT